MSKYAAGEYPVTMIGCKDISRKELSMDGLLSGLAKLSAKHDKGKISLEASMPGGFIKFSDGKDQAVLVRFYIDMQDSTRVVWSELDGDNRGELFMQNGKPMIKVHA